MSTYLLIDIIIILFPLVLSFDRKVKFYAQWRFVFPSIFIVAGSFILWDALFTHLGVWSFNPLHVGKHTLAGLPIEEVLFFIVVPYASLFIYETLNAYWPRPSFLSASKIITPFLSICLLAGGVFFIDRLYTSVTFIALALVLILLHYLLKVTFLGRFYIAYIIVLLPFTVFNGILTGTGIDEAVVVYNNTENLGIRIFTIPFEDIFYGMLLLVLNVFFLELFRKKLRAAH